MLGCGWSGTMGGYKSNISKRCGNSYVGQIEALQCRIGTLENKVLTLTQENVRLWKKKKDKQEMMLTEESAKLRTEKYVAYLVLLLVLLVIRFKYSG
jgi:hypothetical protein